MKWSDDKLKLREQMYQFMDESRDKADEDETPEPALEYQYGDADDWNKIQREGGIERSGRYADLTMGKLK